MNSIIDNIKQRRSIRKYISKKIPKRLIKEIIEAGRYAPSAHNSQPWRFIVITDSKKIKELSGHIKNWFKRRVLIGKAFGFFNKRIKKTLKSVESRLFTDQDLFFYNAPLLVIIYSKSERFREIDCACAAQNMMLAARSLGIGSCWIGFADLALNKNRGGMNELGIPKGCKIIGHIIFGYPAKFPEKALDRNKEAGIVKWI